MKAEEPDAKEKSLAGKRIGLLEHDDGNRMALRHLLSNAGAEVLTLPLPLRHDRVNTESYDLLVVGDLERNSIGELDSLCREMKYPGHRSKYIPLLIVSSLGIDAAADAKKLEDAGADVVLRKPYETQQLVQIAAEMMQSPTQKLNQPIVLEPATHLSRDVVGVEF